MADVAIGAVEVPAVMVVGDSIDVGCCSGCLS